MSKLLHKNTSREHFSQHTSPTETIFADCGGSLKKTVSKNNRNSIQERNEVSGYIAQTVYVSWQQAPYCRQSSRL
jgi:hypothetical protein